MLICDLAETYHITDYKSLPPSVVAILVAGLRENSRLIMKERGAKAPENTILLAAIVDRIDGIMAAWSGTERNRSILESYIDVPLEEKKNSNIVAFESPEDFIAARYGGR